MKPLLLIVSIILLCHISNSNSNSNSDSDSESV